MIDNKRMSWWALCPPTFIHSILPKNLNILIEYRIGSKHLNICTIGIASSKGIITEPFFVLIRTPGKQLFVSSTHTAGTAVIPAVVIAFSVWNLSRTLESISNSILLTFGNISYRFSEIVVTVLSNNVRN